MGQHVVGWKLAVSDLHFGVTPVKRILISSQSVRPLPKQFVSSRGSLSSCTLEIGWLHSALYTGCMLLFELGFLR